MISPLRNIIENFYVNSQNFYRGILCLIIYIERGAVHRCLRVY
jgi:hypothetical protein